MRDAELINELQTKGARLIDPSAGHENRKKTCPFCAIGQSLAAGRTIAHNTPAQLAEVAKGAVALDGITHMVLTTGTPKGPDRSAQVRADSARAIKAAVAPPIQAQCEPPEDDIWHQRMFDAGVDTLGMHLEAVTHAVRARIMPDKASVPLEKYFSSFVTAVKVFRRGQVSTYILAGLGDSAAAILDMAESLVAIGVYPFVMPFVPISGTPLESHLAPSAAFMASILHPLSQMTVAGGMQARDTKAAAANAARAQPYPPMEKLRHS